MCSVSLPFLLVRLSEVFVVRGAACASRTGERLSKASCTNSIVDLGSDEPLDVTSLADYGKPHRGVGDVGSCSASSNPARRDERLDCAILERTSFRRYEC